MQELSLNVLDIAQNSVRADASVVKITVDENVLQDILSIKIEDDGCGMSEEQVENVVSPFFTSRTTRKVGLGVPFFKMAAEMSGGTFEIKSKLNVGTTVLASFVHSHIDRMPLGDINQTIISLVQCNPDIDFLYTYAYNEKQFVFDTVEIKAVLDGVPLSSPMVVTFLTDYLNEHTAEIKNQ